MLKQKFDSVKTNNDCKQYIPTNMPWSECAFIGSDYSFNGYTEQKYAWNRERLRC